MKINSAEDAATNLHLINNTAHPKSKHTIAKEQVEEKKISKFLEYFEYFLRELSDETFDVALSSLKCQLY